MPQGRPPNCGRGQVRRHGLGTVSEAGRRGSSRWPGRQAGAVRLRQGRRRKEHIAGKAARGEGRVHARGVLAEGSQASRCLQLDPRTPCPPPMPPLLGLTSSPPVTPPPSLPVSPARWQPGVPLPHAGPGAGGGHLPGRSQREDAAQHGGTHRLARQRKGGRRVGR